MWLIDFCSLYFSDCGILTSSVAFDLGYSSLFPCLAAGAGFHIIPKSMVLSAEILLDYIGKSRISYLKMTPSLFAALTESRRFSVSNLSGLRFILLGGEAIRVEDVKRTHRVCPDIEFINHYGPTEATIGCIACNINTSALEDYAGNPFIGRPIANTVALIVDRSLNLAPSGCCGEICIAGEGVALGYLNRPELNEERFIRSPLQQYPLMYRTGDLGRWNRDGVIEFLGRVDHQVKIRGYRLELGEIEHALRACTGVEDAVAALAPDSGGGTVLCGYIVAKDVNVEALTGDLREKIPDYMIPAVFVPLDSIPLTPNGKVDRRSLPAPDFKEEKLVVPPRDQMERELCDIWSTVLGIPVDTIGIDTNFFKIGGHSLAAVHLASWVHRQFQAHVSLPVFFQNPTVAGLARAINTSATMSADSICSYEKRDFFPLSPAQTRVFISSSMRKDSVAYNMPVALKLYGAIDPDAIERTFNRLVLRHPSLRTGIFTWQGKPVQRVMEGPAFEFRVERWSNDSMDLDAKINGFIRPFQLPGRMLFRVLLAALDREEYLLLLDMHHIIADGTSRGILVNDFVSLYSDSALPDLSLHYSDYVLWTTTDDTLQDQRNYWLREFEVIPSPIQLPYDYPRDPVSASPSGSFSFSIAEDLLYRLRQLALSRGGTLYMALLSIFFLLLWKLSGQESITVGTVSEGRRHVGLQKLVGMFVNTLAMRHTLTPGMVFLEFLQEVKVKALRGFENQNYPFEDLVRDVLVDREDGRNPLFDVMFVLENVHLSRMEIPGLTMERYPLSGGMSKFDLTLSAHEQGDGLAMNLEFRADLFDLRTIQTFASYYVRIAECVAATPSIHLEDIEIMSLAEKRRVLVDFNDTSLHVPPNATLPGLAARWAMDFPDGIALKHNDCQLTYSLFWANVRRLRQQFKGRGVGRGTFVPLLLERSIEMVAAMTAVMSLGAAYLPVDPDYPPERIRYLLNDSQARFLVTRNPMEPELRDIGDTVECLCVSLDGDGGPEGEGIVIDAAPGDCAYVIYTSGSTGRPKGVMVEHRNAVNVVSWFGRRYGLAPGIRVLQLTSYTFDASVNQIFGTLGAGALLLVVDRFLAVDYVQLREYIAGQRIHIINFVPQFLRELLGEGPVLTDLQRVISGGEPLTGKTKDIIVAKGYNLYNQYGPTETTIDATMDRCGAGEPTLGRPIGNTRCYILDRYSKAVPLGVPGELYIAGDGVARGYLNNPQLTAGAFVVSELDPLGRMYKTGDRARWLEDGRIEFLGRFDHQVKVRGYRIELLEVEHALLSHAHVAQAVVVCRGQEEENQALHAYVVLASGFPQGHAEKILYDHMAGIVPDYMIPSFFIPLDKIPMTGTGKIDRRALPSVEKPAKDFGSRPRTLVELRLREIWGDVLGIDAETIGPHDNFFELGGHSLKVVKLSSAINKEFQVRIPLADIFRNPQIAGLSACIERSDVAGYEEIAPQEKRDYYAVSPAQKRIFILQQMERDNVNYNVPVFFPIDEAVGDERIQEIFQTLAARHESLRTCFVLHHGVPVQRIHDPVPVDIQGYDLTKGEYPGWWQERLSLAVLEPGDLLDAFVRPFDLAEAPLFRAELLKVEDSRRFLMLDLHHIITDAGSMEILRTEFEQLCAGVSLTGNKLNYRDYTSWLAGSLETERYQRLEGFWLGQFAGEIPILELPMDLDESRGQDFSGGSARFALDETEVSILERVASQCQATMFIVLAAVLNILLARLSNQEDIVVGIPIAGRRHADLENIVGVFVNTLPFRNFPCNAKTLREFILEVKERAFQIFEYQDYPFEELVGKLDVRRDTGRNPLFDVLFNFLDLDREVEVNPKEGDAGGGFHTERKVKFDLSVTATQVKNTIQVYFRYKSRLFRQETIETFIQYFRHIVAHLERCLTTAIERIPLAPKGEPLRTVTEKTGVSQTAPNEGLGSSDVFVPPRDRIEMKLAEAWSEVLGVPMDTISIDHDFFKHGGHSLKAVQMLTRIQKHFNVKISLKEFFSGATIRQLANIIVSVEVQGMSDSIVTVHGDCFPLSSAQKRMVVLQHLDPEGCGYNIPIMRVMEGDPDFHKVEHAFRLLIQRHETLRTSYAMKDGQPVQTIHPNVDFKVEYFNREKENRFENHEETDRLIKAFIRPFDLSRAPLLRVGIILLGNGRNILMVDLHHIVSDGSSLVLLINDFGALYSGRRLKPLEFQYKDYVVWQQRPEVMEQILEDKRFWISQFSEKHEALELCTDFPRPRIQTMAGETLKFSVSPPLTAALAGTAEEHGGTLYMVLLVALNVLLARLSGQQDIVIGCPVAGRLHADFEGIVGMFVNTLAIRSFPVFDKTIGEFIEEVGDITLHAFEHQMFQFEELVDELDIPRDTSRNPIFDVMFVFQNMEQATLELPGMNLAPYHYETNIAKFDLNLIGMEADGQLFFTLEYRTDLFVESTVRNFVSYFKMILAAFTHQRERTLGSIELLESQEKRAILELCVGNEDPFAGDVTVLRLFEQTSAAHPNRIALGHNDGLVSYGELNRRAGLLAETLRRKGARREGVVGVMAERSFEMIVGVLAILKAGGAILPLDSHYPDERIRFMIQDSGASLVLVKGDLRGESEFKDMEIQFLDLNGPAHYSPDTVDIPGAAMATDSLYLIYTSGSTGKPKGVLLEHRNLVNLLLFQFNRTSIDFSRVLQFATICFDVSFQEIFSTLSYGGRLSLIDAEVRNQVAELFSVVSRHDIKTMFLPVAFLSFIFGQEEFAADVPPNVRHIIAAGEQLKVGDLLEAHLRKHAVWLHNHYGPSESHVVSTFSIDPRGNIPRLPPIGKPVSNTGMFIMDLQGNLQPPGVPGELRIGGVQVGRGYCNRPELTGRRFISDPVSGERLYCTGDIARLMTDGNFEFLGRQDQQVKIRGFRVEPGEIEIALSREIYVESAVVIPYDDGGENRLIAYIVTDADCRLENSDIVETLRESLLTRLPDYMVPEYVEILEQLPLTPSGKIDRSRLPEPTIRKSHTLSPPRNDMDTLLVKIWAGVLGLEAETFGIDCDFFALGGHSLKAIALVSMIFRQTQKKVPLIEVFSHPTIRRLSDYMSKLSGVAEASVDVTEKMDYYPVSSPQKRMYILQMMQPESTAYNLPAFLRLEGEVDISRLRAVFRSIVHRHEILRTSFVMMGNQVVQRVMDGREFNVEFHDCAPSQDRESRIREIASRFVRPFDLAVPMQLRVGLISVGENEHVFMADMHHIVSDARSIQILVKELTQLYGGAELPELNLQYRDYAAWQHRLITVGEIERQEDFWLKEFPGDIPLLALPVDVPRGNGVNSRRGGETFRIDGEAAGKMKMIAHRERTTLFMFLLTVYYIFLSKMCRQEDIIVGTVVTGRRHPDLEDIIGMFVNTLALRNYPSGDKTFIQFLREVMGRVLQAFENQDYQFEDLVEKFVAEREPGRNPLFDTMFSFASLERSSAPGERDSNGQTEPSLRVRPFQREGESQSKFDLLVTGVDEGDFITVSIGYSMGLFKKETIERFVDYFSHIISVIVDNPSVLLEEIEMTHDLSEAKSEIYEGSDSEFEF
jgi:amino acid adenylation domain-containing protein